MMCGSVQLHGFEMVRLSEEHTASVAELERLCFSTPISQKNLESILLGGIGAGFVCIETKSGTVAAYGGVMVAADEAQVLNVATHPGFRKMGLGRAIVNTIINHARSSGAEFITLEVRENNSAAIALYKSFDFYEVGRLKKYYKDPCEDALILKKELGSL